jgi:hypothetical protein
MWPAERVIFTNGEQFVPYFQGAIIAVSVDMD